MTDIILYTNEIDWKRTLLKAERVSQRPRSKKISCLEETNSLYPWSLFDSVIFMFVSFKFQSNVLKIRGIIKTPRSMVRTSPYGVSC